MQNPKNYRSWKKMDKFGISIKRRKRFQTLLSEYYCSIYNTVTVVRTKSRLGGNEKDIMYSTRGKRGKQNYRWTKQNSATGIIIWYFTGNIKQYNCIRKKINTIKQFSPGMHIRHGSPYRSNITPNCYLLSYQN